MAEETPKEETAEKTESAPKKAATKRPRVKPDEVNKKAKAVRVKCSEKVRSGSGMIDPGSGIRIPRYDTIGVEISGPVKEGSWLDVQIDAGLVVPA